MPTSDDAEPAAGARPDPRRRTVAAGAAWATPAILLAAAVPSLAASPVPLPTCGSADAPQCMVFWTPNSQAASLTNTFASTNAILPTPPSTTPPAPPTSTSCMSGSGTATAVFTSNTNAFYGSGSLAYEREMNTWRSTTATPVGGDTRAGYVGQDWLSLAMQATTISTANPRGQTVTVTFPTTVYGVTFEVADIDYLSGSWRDRVSVQSVSPSPSSAPFTATVPNPHSPAYYSVTNASSGSATVEATTDATGAPNSVGLNYYDPQALVVFSSPKNVGLTSFSLTYTNTAVGMSNQVVLVSPISFYTSPCV